MRTTLLVLTMIAAVALAGPSPAIASPFCDGYAAGFARGYCDRSGACLPAPHPARAGRSDSGAPRGLGKSSFKMPLAARPARHL